MSAVRKLTPEEAAKSISILHFKESRIDSWLYFEKYQDGFCALVKKEFMKMKNKKSEEILMEYQSWQDKQILFRR